MAKKKTPEKSSSDPVTAYANAVLSGKITAGPHVRNACRRHLDDLRTGHERGLYFDLEAAERFLRFCRTVCRLKDGQFDGRPFIPSPPQEFILGSIYGWKRKSTGFRRFRRAYVEMGKGNGKSPMAAAIGLYGLVADDEPSTEIYAAGKDKNQAFVLFRDAVSMVTKSPLLSSRIIPSGGTGSLVENLAYLKTGSFFRVISREGASSGPRPAVALCDELHEHPNGDVIEMLERGFKSRRQPLLFLITNSGSDRNSICWAEHQNAVKIAAGTNVPDEDFTYVGETWDGSDDTFSYVCALDKDDDPFTDPSCWVKANPMLGVILTPEYMEGNVAQARNIPMKRNGILRLHFCVWTESDTTWIPRPLIDRVMFDFDPYVEHQGKTVTGAGLDLSKRKDLTSAAFCVQTGTKTVTKTDGTPTELPTYDLWVESWTPGGTMDERSKIDHVPYRVWAESFHKNAAGEELLDQPYLRAIEGDNIRPDHIAAHFARMATTNLMEIAVLGYDLYAYQAFQDELDGYGLDLATEMHPQGGKRRSKPSEAKIEAAKAAGEPAPLGHWMPGSVGKLEELILEERIRIRKSPVTITALMGVYMETDDLMGVSWFNKNKATVRIDPAVAGAMAVGVATNGVAVQEKSFWQTLDPSQI